MLESTPPTYLNGLVVCGLCFKMFDLGPGGFSCPTGCSQGIPAQTIEAVLWKELGHLLATPEGKRIARMRLREKISGPEFKRLFQGLQNFVEFLPPEEKSRFSQALVEKIVVLTPDHFEIHFHL